MRLAKSPLLIGWALTASLGSGAVDSARAQSFEKTAVAVRIQGESPRIDGSIDEAVWESAHRIADFVQKIPNEGTAPSVLTEVWILYDDDALYVAARLRRPDPEAIRTSVTRRDGESDAELFRISIDPYLDRRTGYTFSVSSGSVRGDWYHPQDQEKGGREAQYDPVWSARARVDEQGWTAEMRIPFSQLRFSAVKNQVWGLQLTRDLPDKGEQDQWVLIPQAAAGYASRFGRLIGISEIPAVRRLELLPYVAADLRYRGNVDPADPFDDRVTGRAGADLKLGLGPNLTLDATINPDFGQVEADPAVVNLTAFETVFDERRPFFIEGNELLTGRGQSFLGRPTWFYSRRIGAPPRGSARAEFVEQPANTTILTAAKVTGRLASGMSIGALAAVTPREYATVYDPAVDPDVHRVPVEPPSTVGVVRIQQEVGSQQSNVGATVTHVYRSLDSRGELRELLPRSALAAGFDWKARFMEGMYEVTGWLGASRVEGHAEAIARLQQVSSHLYQRPDQDHVHYDPTRSSLSGVTASIRGDKNAGRFTLGGIQLSTRSPGFDINDVGQMRSGDDIDFNADIQLRDTRPNRLVRYFQFGTSTQIGWNYGWIRQYVRVTQSGRITLHNFWNISARGTLHRRAQSDELTRGGPLLGTPSGYAVSAQVNSRPNVPTTWTARVEYFDDEFGGWRWDGSTGLSVRPTHRWQASLDLSYSRSVDTRQYVATIPSPSATYQRRWVFSSLERSTLSGRLRLNYALTPDFTIEGYAEPFAASGRFFGFGEVPVQPCTSGTNCPVSRALRLYGSSGSGTSIAPSTDGYEVRDGEETFLLPVLDFNRLSFRSNLVLRWEWLPGSTAYLIWQQARQDEAGAGSHIGLSDLWAAAGAEGDNFFVAKVSYWLGSR